MSENIKQRKLNFLEYSNALFHHHFQLNKVHIKISLIGILKQLKYYHY